MSSEQLADGVNPLDAELAATWDVLKGYSGRDTDLGIARRFGGAAAAYSLRDIGAMNGSVVRVRREPNDTTAGIDDEERFSANQVQDGTLERWVNGELESTLPADVATAAAAYSLRKVKASYSGDAVRIRRIDNTEVDVAFDSDGKVSTSSSITNVGSGDIDNTNETTLGNFLQGEADVRALFNASAYLQDANAFYAPSSTITLSGAFTMSWSVIFTDSFTTNTSRMFNYSVNSDRVEFSSDTRLFIRIGGSNTPIDIDGTMQLGRKYDLVLTRNASNVLSLSIDGVTQSNTVTNANDYLINQFGFRHIGVLTALNINGEHIYAGDGSANSNWLDTGSVGGKNATASGSPQTFTGQGMDSFVDIWYDQAGSNNAVQETAGNQPKIAENGALLADGLKFNGNSDNFTITNGVSGRSIFAVTNQNIDTTAGGLTGYGQDGISSLLGTAGANSYIFVSNNNSAFNSYAISIDGATSDSGQYASNGKTLSSAGGNLGTYGDIPSDTNSLLSIIYGSGDPAFDWTRLGSGVNGNIFMQGSMSEVILYTTDQTDNKFKIESNINNYYGLYNDANETNGDFGATFSPTADGTFTPNGKDGFTLAVVSSTVYAGIKLNEDVISGDSVYVSFNCSFDAGSPSPKIVLRNTDSDFFGGGTIMSNEESVVNGFNSFTLTSTNSLASGVVLSEADDNLTYSISDFKVSRIARNGFVETWYDQSGSGNNATQTTASNQPAIVQNGGLIADGIKFDGSADALNFTDLTLTDASIFTVLDIDGTENLQIILGGSTTTVTATMIPMMQTSSTTTQVYKNATVGGAEQGNSQFRNGSQITLNNRGDAYTELAAQDKMLFTMIDVDVAADKVLDGISQTPSDATTWALKGTMEELIIYNSDLSSDRGTIESEIANHYNITLS